VQPKQRELALWEQLQAAQRLPETSNVGNLLDAVEATTAQLSDAAQLRLAGEALLQVATLCAARAELLLTEWEETYRDPIVAQGFFADVVRQSMAVDLGDLMASAPPRQRHTKATGQAAGSLAAPVDKAAALALVDQLEAEATAAVPSQPVWTIAHDEDVSRWTAAIAHWLQVAPERTASLAELCCGLGRPWVEVWLGVLLGGFELEQQGEFYQAPIWVKYGDEVVVASTVRQAEP
jgi:hypothetical protein